MKNKIKTTIDQLLLIQQQILAILTATKPPQVSIGNPIQWYAVAFHLDRCQFDLDTIRQEPGEENQPNPRLWKQPFLYPWIYLPAKPNILMLTARHIDRDYTPLELVTAAVEWLNTQCTWQTPLPLIRAAVERLGGVLLESAATGIIPPHVPPPRYRKPVTTRLRSRTMTSSLPHAVAKLASRREDLQARANRKGYSFVDHNAEPHLPGTRCRQVIPAATPYAAGSITTRKPQPLLTLDDIAMAMEHRLVTQADDAARAKKLKYRLSRRKQPAPPLKEYIPAASRVMFQERMLARCAELKLRPYYAAGVEPLTYMGMGPDGYTDRLFIVRPISE